AVRGSGVGRRPASASPRTTPARYAVVPMAAPTTSAISTRATPAANLRFMIGLPPAVQDGPALRSAPSVAEGCEGLVNAKRGCRERRQPGRRRSVFGYLDL